MTNLEQLVQDTDIYNADFETAITATKFGKFNVLLFLLAIPAGWTSTFETTTMSYVFPAAHCDLHLSLTDRGFLNAITFAGMISSGLFWGILCDTFGRKKLMVVGYFLDALFVIMSSFSQSFIVLIIFKFFGGFIINGSFTGLTSYLSEFHSTKYRSRVQLARGTIVSCGNLVLPLLAWAILPQQIHISLFNDYIILHSWNIYILVCAIPSLLSGLVFIFMPESPRFLMTAGRKEKALKVFQLVYSINTGKKKEEFQIKSLMVSETEPLEEKENEKPSAKKSKSRAIKESLQQIRTLCFPPHIKNIILVCSLQSIIMLSTHTLRLWFPQIFQAISDYQYYNNGSSSDLCTMLGVLTPSRESNRTCHVHFSPTVYMNTMIVQAVTMTGYILTGTIINKLGKKRIIGLFSCIAGVCAMSLYFAKNTPTAVTLSAFFLALGSVCQVVVVTITIELFPTSFRAVTVSVLMTLGRAAALVGNIIFPLLLSLGCAPPFFTVGIGVMGCMLLVVLLPNTELKALV